MSVDAYFIFALFGPDLGFLLVVGAVPLLIYSWCTRKAHRSLMASRIALILSIVSVLLSTILWIELFSGHFRYGDPVNYKDPDFSPYEIIAVLEALALLISLVSTMRHRAKRTS